MNEKPKMQTTMMTWHAQQVLQLCADHRDEFVAVPDDVAPRTLASLQDKDWIVVNETAGGQMMKLTGRGLIALRTAKVYRHTVPVDELPVPAHVAETTPEKNGHSNGMSESVAVALDCDDCLDCDAARLLERIKTLDPRIARVIEAWGDVYRAERAFKS